MNIGHNIMGDPYSIPFLKSPCWFTLANNDFLWLLYLSFALFKSRTNAYCFSLNVALIVFLPQKWIKKKIFICWMYGPDIRLAWYMAMMLSRISYNSRISGRMPNFQLAISVLLNITQGQTAHIRCTTGVRILSCQKLIMTDNVW